MSLRAKLVLPLSALAVLGVGLLVAPARAHAAGAGRPVAWGCQTFNAGQCNVPTGLRGVVAVAAGDVYSLALKRDGTVVAWGCIVAPDYGQCRVPNGLSGVVSIATGHAHGVALKSDGTVVAWGCFDDWDYGQCNVPAGLASVTAIAAGNAHSLALRSDGTVVAWGCSDVSDHGQCDVPGALGGVTAIAAGASHSLALRTDGSVVAWGCGPGTDYSQCNVPSGLTGVIAIAADNSHSLALKDDGTVVAWGCTGGWEYGQCDVPGGLLGVTAVAAGLVHSVALNGDGTVAAWGCVGGYDAGQCTVPAGLSRVIAVSAGFSDSLALIELLDQTITFGLIANKTFGDADFAVIATASSGLPVGFDATGDCSMIGAVAHLIRAGSCTIAASQPGNENYNPAPNVVRTFSIAAPPHAPPPQPLRCVVPKVTGLRLLRARSRIRARHCTVGRVRRAHSRRVGRVLAQSPRPGKRLRRGGHVNLVVGRR